MKTVYIDTNVFNRIVVDEKNELQDDEAHALENLCDNPEIEFKTAVNAYDEISKISNNNRRSRLKFTCRLTNLVKKNVTHFRYKPFAGSMPLGVPLGSSGEYPRSEYSDISRIFKKSARKDKNDIEHLFQANINKCDYFLTFDQELINIYKKNKEKLEEHGLNTQVVNPIKLVQLI